MKIGLRSSVQSILKSWTSEFECGVLAWNGLFADMSMKKCLPKTEKNSIINTLCH